MKKDQLKSEGRNRQEKSISKGKGHIEVARTNQVSNPLAAQVTSYSGSGRVFQVQVTGQNISGTFIEQAWNAVRNAGTHSAHAYFSLVFDQPLPASVSWVLKTDTGTVISTGVTQNATQTLFRFILRPLSNGQPSFTGSNTYTVELNPPFIHANLSRTITTTGGGLVVIANVDADEEFYEYEKGMKQTMQSMHDHHYANDDGN